VRRAFFTWLLYAALATIGLFVARMLAPGRHELELDIYVLTLGGVALLAVSSVLGDVAPREDESQLEEAMEPEQPEPARIAELERLEREVALASSRDFDLHFRLRPVLREIAESQLERRGVQLDSESPRVRELLGDELLELTAADREPSAYREAPGLPLEDLKRTVERLERLKDT
jgi:hypothetical protein